MKINLEKAGQIEEKTCIIIFVTKNNEIICQ